MCGQGFGAAIQQDSSFQQLSSISHSTTCKAPSLNVSGKFWGGACQTSEQAGSDMDRPHESGNKRLNVLEPKHKIFLSHSGAQKSFVADLHKDLMGRDRHAFFDKCRSSLPVGEPFPKLIFNAIEQCAVGVVVLSEEFFTKTKWPMLELVAMVKESKKPNRRISIIPVFYKISREECRNATVQNEWVTKYWKKWEEEDKRSRIHIEEWKEALSIFGSRTGVIMKEGVLDGELREEIVKAVCKNVHPETRWDDSNVHGRTYLYEEICRKIYGGCKPKDLNLVELQVVGLYGMGGMGKTTACKVLCNALNEDYDDKVCHAKFGNGSELELLKKVLKAFSNLDAEILGNIRDVEECQGYLKKHILKTSVFLALDNVSDETKEQAKMILGNHYGSGSVVMVTARSVDVLLCVGIEKKKCFAMPELEREEAKALFLSHGRLKEDEVDFELLEMCMERCHFSKGGSSLSWDSDGGKHYHPLALKALGIEVGDEIRKHGKARQGELLRRIENFNMSRRKVHPVFCILRSSFDSLLEEDQLLFLHIALFLPFGEFTGYWVAIEWLGIVHGEKANEIELRLECLKYKSLLESFGIKESHIKMHDLWREFAEAEIKAERFVGRVFLNDGKGISGRVDLTRFPEMGVVKVELKEDAELNMHGLKHLASLDICSNDWGGLVRKMNGLGTCMSFKSLDVCSDGWGGSVRVVKGLGSLENLTFLSSCYVLSRECFEEAGSLTNLQVLELVGFKDEKLPDLSKMTSLRMLKLYYSQKLRIISLQNLTSLVKLHLENNFRLESVNVCGCTSIKKLKICGVPYQLKELNVSSCPLLQQVVGLEYQSDLRTLDISGCRSMDYLDAVKRLQKLEELRARNCDSLAMLPRCTLPKLRVLDIEPWKEGLLTWIQSAIIEPNEMLDENMEHF